MIVKYPSELSRRFKSATIAILFLSLLFIIAPSPLGPIFLGVVLLLLFKFSQQELEQLFKAKEVPIEKNICLLWLTLGMSLLFFTTKFASLDRLILTLNIAVMLHTFFSTWRKPEHPIALILGGTLLSFNYLAIPLLLLYYTLFKNPFDVINTRWILLYLVAIIKACDIGGYFAGKTLGKHPLAPILSPKKTWEGLFGGALASGLLSMGFSHLFLIGILPLSSISIVKIPLDPRGALVFGIFLAVVAQVGDLFESGLKRESRVKDSGVIPGLGGMLDMLDSFLFAFPVGIIILSYGS
jgi:phosphatidate cytidylyltransferase